MKHKIYTSYLEWLGDIEWVPAEMNRCIQTDHFLSAVVSQGASLRWLMGPTPKKGKKMDMTGLFSGIKMITSSNKEPVEGNISVKSSLFFTQTQELVMD